MARIALLCLFAALLAGCSNVATAERPARSCVSPRAVVPIGFSATKYPNIRRHYKRAVAHGFPAVLVVHRSGTDARRDRLLQSRPTRRGMDRDEYPRPRIVRTARRSGSSSAATATARAFATSSTENCNETRTHGEFARSARYGRL
jgi:hypothetical protein